MSDNITRLYIDIETYSSVDLTSCGVYPYAESSDFEIMLFAYAWGDDDVQCVRLAEGEKLPHEVVDALVSEEVEKHAYNAMFERVCISNWLKTQGLGETPVASWHCTRVHALMAGYSGSLDAVGSAIGLPHDKKKLSHGKQLVRYFSMPNRDGGRNLPHHDRAKWEAYVEYCKRDVEAEREVTRKLSHYKVSRVERDVYVLDQQINDCGVAVDSMLVGRAIQCSERANNIDRERMCELTGIVNPNSVAAIKRYIKEHEGIDVPSLRKADVAELLTGELRDETREVLELRGELSKTSVKKYLAIKNCTRADGRVGGLLQYYGARTGRWAGRLVQVQNLPRNEISPIDDAREFVRVGDYEAIEMLYGSVQDTLSQLVRTAFVAEDGMTFAVVDFSAIEARVIAWLSGERWRMDVFSSHGKIYEASASAMFGVPIEQITKGSELRSKGKIAELALGFGGSVGALRAMGADKMGLSDDELVALVASWRKANPRIVALWSSLQKGALAAVSDGRMQCDMPLPCGVSMKKRDGDLVVTLPSGREMCYVGARVEKSKKYGSPVVTYMGRSSGMRWERIETYGGKLAENIVQAVARDVLAWAMLRLDAEGYNIVMHIHDEVVIEVQKHMSHEHLKQIERIMCEALPWADGLVLGADGYTTDYYLKD